jgi:transposase
VVRLTPVVDGSEVVMTLRALVKRGASSRREGPSVEKLGLTKAKPSRRKKVPVQQPEYVGIDLHRRRSVIVRMSPDGEHLSTTKIDNDPVALAKAIAPAGPNPEVIVEATYGWYWAADVLEECGARVHLAHPLGMKGITSNRRVKNDVRDAVLLADLLRLGSLPEAWIAPPPLRELRELVRYRTKLVNMRSSLKAQAHAVMAKEGVLPALSDMFGPGGQVLLDEMPLGHAYRMRMESLRDLMAAYDEEVHVVEAEVFRQLKDHRGYRAIQAIDGVGRVFGAIFVAEIGDIHRFPGPQQLCSWAGLTPRHHESDTTVHRGSITKQGSRLVRWAAIEAVTNGRGGPKLRADFHRIAVRRGTAKARVAVARKLLGLVYYGLRDGEIRCLAETG